MAYTTRQSDSSKAEKAIRSNGDNLVAEISNTLSPSRRQEYPEVNAAIDRGLADVAAGRVHTRRSYAEYANIEIED